MVKLTEAELNILKKLLARVSSAPPIVISARTLCTCFLPMVLAEVLTDGGVEGVLVNPSGNLAMFFSEKVPTELMQWVLSVKTH